ncbi:GNAT family N-acetyltransferase [Paenibacillus aurantiacus]|uniref:GNAT family N-acetyltransferase n=1 Tax=Paenibacillus aurantiacus TaxID=1936118 RepID=A0ABV5KUI4_9BACL
MELIDIHSDNVHEHGFFCMRSKPKSTGYRKKLAWLTERFKEGLHLKMVVDEGQPRGFIEYMPSEYNWRGISGANYIVIHCLWIVGKGKGKGYGSSLLQACIAHAKALNKSGVAMVTSSETWLSDKAFFLKHGFASIDAAPPSFELIVNRFDDQPPPAFNHGWEKRAEAYAEGLTVIRADQCPYFEEAVNTFREAAAERGIPFTLVDIDHCQDAQHGPSPYGVFHVLLNGSLLTYHPMSKRELHKRLDVHLLQHAGN